MQISGSGNSAMLQQMQAMRNQMFQKADADKSGGINLDEFKTAGQNMPVGAKGAQAPQNAEKAFAKIDTNGDGNLTSDEMEAFKPKFDASSMSALLGAQESSQSEETDPATTLLNILNGNSDGKSGSTQSTSADDLVSELMDMLNASSEKSAKAEGANQNLDNLKAQLNKAYSGFGANSGSSLNLAA
jgi:Ca2+-binding EF-hand superfamily protein